MIDLYPGATWAPSVIPHPMRRTTLGIVMHWTVGREPGDVTTLQGKGGRRVDCHFYVPKDATAGPGKQVYQFLDPDSVGWHAYETANETCIGIEHETSGEPYTPAQFAASAALVAYLCKRYAIPVVHVDPSGHDLSTFRGIFGHRDLSLGGVRVDSNDHTDTVPTGTGWGRYLQAVNDAMGLKAAPPAKPLPYSGSLRVAAGGRIWYGWEDAKGAILWIANNGLEDPDAFITWRGSRWNGPAKTTAVARNLARRFLGWRP